MMQKAIAKKSDILIILPAYNEEDNIVSVVSEIKDKGYDFVIVNDGSTDKTRDLCKKNSFNMIDYSVNLGLKMAFLGGVTYAWELGYDYVIQYDADGQHDVRYIDALLTWAKQKNTDVVIGSRFINCDKSYSCRMLGSRLLSFLIKLMTKKNITDPTSGMRLYNRNAMRMLLNQVVFGPEPDFVVHLLHKGMRVDEVEVTMKERKSGKSYLDFWTSLKYMVSICSSIVIMEQIRK